MIGSSIVIALHEEMREMREESIKHYETQKIYIKKKKSENEKDASISE